MGPLLLKLSCNVVPCNGGVPHSKKDECSRPLQNRVLEPGFTRGQCKPKARLNRGA